jgi:hypothetical protein
MILAGTVAGGAAAVAAYHGVASSGDASPASAKTGSDQTPAAVVTTAPGWRPCERGWKLQGNTCVRVKEKVVVVHDLPPAAPVVSSSGVRRSGHESHDGAKAEHEPGQEAEQEAEQEIEAANGHEGDHEGDHEDDHDQQSGEVDDD